MQACKILNNVAKKCGLQEIGTHTMRKTFGYWHYKQYKDVAILQDIFNHSPPSITLRYIGITDDIKDKTIENFKGVIFIMRKSKNSKVITAQQAQEKILNIIDQQPQEQTPVNTPAVKGSYAIIRYIGFCQHHLCLE